MNKEMAIHLVAQVAAHYPDATHFFVTEDEKIHTSAEAAVAHAVALSPGNPIVFDVSRNELPEGLSATEPGYNDAIVLCNDESVRAYINKHPELLDALVTEALLASKAAVPEGEGESQQTPASKAAVPEGEGESQQTPASEGAAPETPASPALSYGNDTEIATAVKEKQAKSSGKKNLNN